MVLEHGGNLNRAAKAQGIPARDWLDLSTGISPWSWPVPPLPESIWRRLPEEDDGLVAQCRDWLGVGEAVPLLPIAGSQAAIQTLPYLRPTGRVAVPKLGYAEHGHCWSMAGHQVDALTVEEVEAQLDSLDVLVWIQPNNPTGQTLPRSTLLNWLERLQSRGGWLIIDEAFIDASEAESLVQWSGLEGLVILRSVGKFFGLAGIRAGVATGPEKLLEGLAQRLGPWALSGPSRWIMRQALQDTGWQGQQKVRHQAARDQLVQVLLQSGLKPIGGTALFQSCSHPEPRWIQSELAKSAILVRAFLPHQLLRFGLPARLADFERLEKALGTVLGPQKRAPSASMNP